MTRPMYAPEPQGVRSASSSAFEWDDPTYRANRAKLEAEHALATATDRDRELREAAREQREERNAKRRGRA
jgi:hypothetical protein